MPPVVVWRRIEELHCEPQNSRSHSPEQIRQLAKRIAAFGFNVPILINPQLRIVAGHVRLLAALELGWRAVPTIMAGDLSPAQARAFMTADDRRAEAASWDDLLLAMQLKEVSPAAPDRSKPGCRPSARRRMPGKTLPVSHRRGAPATASEAPAEGLVNFRPTEVPGVRDGDVWLLGNHRVHCGNDSDAVAEMLAEEDGLVVVFAPDPAAVGAIIRRWQTLTGGIARRVPNALGRLSARFRAADAPARN